MSRMGLDRNGIMTLPDILTELGIDHRLGGTHEHVREGWVGIDCGWCEPGAGRFHLGIPVNGKVAVCWLCGRHKLGDALAESSGRPLRDVLSLLDGLESSPAARSVASEAKVLYRPPGLQGLARPHRAYLRGRGFNPLVLERTWGLLGFGLGGSLAWRIWIPVHLDGKIVSWTTRSIGTSGLRYLSARPDQEAVPLKTLLYGGDLAGTSVVVCEGPTDVWRLGPGAVATFGLSCTAEQVERLSRFRVRAICFDREPAAERQARRLAHDLAGHPGETHMVELETGADLADTDEEEVNEIRERFLGVGV